MRERLASLTAHHGLALAVLFLGLGFATLTAPFGVPDEIAHFWRACHVSEGHVLAQTRPGEGTGAMLPRSVGEVVETVVQYDSVPQPRPRIDWQGWDRAWRMGFHPEDRAFKSFSSTANYWPLPYVPAAAALALARECHLSVLAGFYLARFANVLAVAALLGLAWRRLPCARESFALTAMLPMTLSLIGSLSVDAISFGCAFLWIALVLNFNFAEEQPGGRRNQIELLVAAALLGQTKFSFPLALLALLCFFRRRSWHRRTLLTSLAALALALLSAALWTVASDVLTNTTRADVAGTAVQTAFILEHPVQFAKVCADTLRAYGVEYGRQIVGVLGWLQIPLPKWLYAGMWLALVLSTGFQGPKEREKLTPAARVFCGSLAVAILLCVDVTLYGTWNPVGAPIIQGVQGRYLILMLPLLGLAFMHPLWSHLHAVRPVRTGVYVFALIANGCALFTQFRAAFG